MEAWQNFNPKNIFSRIQKKRAKRQKKNWVYNSVCSKEKKKKKGVDLSEDWLMEWLCP